MGQDLEKKAGFTFRPLTNEDIQSIPAKFLTDPSPYKPPTVTPFLQIISSQNENRGEESSTPLPEVIPKRKLG
jgi:hypothetical protein